MEGRYVWLGGMLGIGVAVVSCGSGESATEGAGISCGQGTVLVGSICMVAEADAQPLESGADTSADSAAEAGQESGPEASLPEGSQDAAQEDAPFEGGGISCGPGTVLDGSVCVPESKKEPIISDKVTVVDDQTAAAAIVAPDSLIFPAAGNDSIAAKQPGDILVSSFGSGFLRKVSSVSTESGQIIVSTEEASLEDAIQQGSFHASFDPEGPGAQSPPQYPVPMGNPAKLSAGIDLSGTKIFVDDAAGVSVEISSGYVQFSPLVDVAADIDWFKIVYFRCAAIGSFRSELALKAQVAHSYSKSYSTTIWQGAPKAFMQTIAGFPVLEVVRLSVDAGMDINMDMQLSAEAGVGVETTVTAGAEYGNGAWTSLKTLDFEPYVVGPEFTAQAGASVKVYLRPRLEVMFYDVAGPWITLEPSVTASSKLDALQDPPFSWSLEGRVASNYGGEVRLLGKSLASYSAKLFDYPVFKVSSQTQPDAGAGDGGSTLACPPAKADCNGQVSDGCEVSLSNDPHNCGACDNACPAFNAIATCAFGKCGMTCTAPHADCNKSTSDGCEADLQAEIGNCGACGLACSAGPHSVPLCNDGVCTSVCENGWKDCNGNLTDGCEADLKSSATNCGFCGLSCPSGLCEQGVCTASPADGGASPDASLSSGGLAWMKGFPGGGTQVVHGVAVDPSRNLALAGFYAQEFAIGGTTLPITNANANAFVARLDPHGQPLWAKALGAGYAWASAASAVGNLAVGGWAFDTMTIGPLTIPGSDGYFVSYSPAGDYLFGRSLFRSGVRDMLFLPSGELYVTGRLGTTDASAPADFGGVSLISSGGDDLFVAKYSANGSLLWVRRAGGSGTEIGYGIAADASGNAWVTGTYDSPTDFGCGELPYGSVFLAKLDGSSGNCIYSAGFGAIGADYPRVAVTSSDRVVLTVNYKGNISFGAGIVSPPGSIYVAAFDGAGSHIWSHGYGSGNDTVWGLALDSIGNAYLTGGYYNPIDFGGGALAHTDGDQDAYVAKFDSAGHHVWSRGGGGTLAQYGWAIAVQPGGNAIVGGSYQGNLSYDGLVISSSYGSYDPFLAAFVP